MLSAGFLEKPAYADRFVPSAKGWRATRTQKLASQLDALRKSQTMSKSALAARMKTSRAAIDRLLDASNPSVTLLTLQKAAKVLNRRLKVELVEA